MTSTTQVGRARADLNRVMDRMLGLLNIAPSADATAFRKLRQLAKYLILAWLVGCAVIILFSWAVGIESIWWFAAPILVFTFAPVLVAAAASWAIVHELEDPAP